VLNDIKGPHFNQLIIKRKGFVNYLHQFLCVSIDGFELGGALVMYPAYGGANQLWQWGGDNTLVSKMGLVVDIQGGRNEKGTSCIGWYPNSGQNQKWRYENGTNKSTMNNLLIDKAEEVQE